MFEDICWSDVLFKRVEDPFCDKCRAELVEIEGPRCKVCSRGMERDELCGDCEKWAVHPELKDVLTSNISIYQYNPALKEWLKRFKYNGDYALAGCFRKELIETLKPFKKTAIITPVPVSAKRLMERGFNQTEAMLECAGVKYERLLTRQNTETSQAKKQKHDRHTGENPYTVVKKLNGEQIILIDDLYTTGTTIRRAATVLKKAGAGGIRSVTIGR
ncbi:ComF family protein [Jeotgalibacillus sp. JSM ZJ347]|uniref:ComF family protein n=1 Tax=Jeotgalibacillus sp. JSM ZJ347 TaxID=3342117 RepID=UPI0035A86400